MPGRDQRRWGIAAAGFVVAAVVAAALVLVLRNSSSDPSPSRSASGQDAGAALDDSALATEYLSAISAEISAVTSYDYRHLSDALSSGLAVTTSPYRTAYRRALTGAVAVAARRNRTVAAFEVQHVGIGAVTDGGASAKVLVFGVQITTAGPTSASRTKTRVPVALTVTARRGRDGAVLISRLAVGANPGLPPGDEQLSVAAEAAREAVVRRRGRPVTAVAVESASRNALALLVVTSARQRYVVTVHRDAGDWTATATAIAPVGSS